MTENEERALLLTYRPWLRGVARKMVADSLVDELAQEGWIAIWRELHHTRDATAHPAPQDWQLKHTAIWRMAACRRDWSEPMKQRQHSFTADVVAVADLPHELGDLELAYHHGEIHAAMGALSPREQEYVIQRFWHGMEAAQLKIHFGYSPNGLWRTGRPKLALALAHLGDDLVAVTG